MTAIVQAGARWRNRPFVPSAQLAEAVMREAAKSSLAHVCEEARVPERVVMRWRRGESGGNVDLALADLVMTRLDMFWWEIWTEDTVREPLFTVTTYFWCSKRDKQGVPKRRRIKDRTIPYGDLGTDFWRLREIRALMSGGLAEEMAA